MQPTQGRVRGDNDRAVTQSIQIASLVDLPHARSILAAWHVEAFGEWLGGWSVADCLNELETHGPPGRVPFTLVALQETDVLGSISLIQDDPPAPTDLGPWLASFYVRPDLRGQGIGTLLHDRLLKEASDLGLREMYLWTPDASAWYAGRGWEHWSSFMAYGRASQIMRMSLPGGNPAKSHSL